MFVGKPCIKILFKEFLLLFSVLALVLLLLRKIIDKPIYSKYKQPIALTRINAVAEVARIADSPNAAARICTKVPLPTPNAAIEPARKPWLALLPIMYSESGPGSMLRIIPDTTNNQRFSIPNMPLIPMP